MENHDAVKKSEFSSFRCSGGHGSCWIIGMISLMVLVAGLWSAKKSGEEADLQMRRELVQQVVGLAAAVDPESIRTLSFTAEDKDHPAFRLLCGQMAAYAEATGVRSLYTMALRDGKIVFGPESLPEGDSYASPPGTVYQKPTQKDFDLFTTARPQIQGPVSDEYGTFVTALAPVVDLVTGEVLAAVGIDVEAQEWKAAVRRAQWIPGGITLGLVAILFLSGLILRLRQHLSPEHAIRMRQTEPFLGAVFMSALTAALAIYFSQVDRNTRRNAFYSIAQTHAAVSVAQFHDINLMLEQLAGFFESSEQVEEDEFSTYCRKIMQSGTIQNCVWIPAVPNEFADEFVQTVKDDGVPDFSIWQKNTDGLRAPVSVRPVCYPVLYMEPMSSKAVLGYDEGSDPTRAAAVQRALNIGLSTATDPVPLVTSTNPQPALLIFKPVHAVHQKGLVAFVVRPEKLLGGVRPGDTKADLDICLSQLRHGEEPLLMAGSSLDCGRECWSKNESGLSFTVPIFCFGKTYALNMVPEADWLAAHPLDSGWQAVGVGALVTLLVSSLIGLLTNRRVKLEKMVERRTNELTASETRFRNLVENLNEVFFSARIDGTIEYVSPAITDILGYQPEEMLGKPYAGFFHPDDVSLANATFAKVMAGNDTVQEYRMLTRSGEFRWVQISTPPVQKAQDGTAAVQGVLMDITERKQAEEMLIASRERQRQLTQHLETVREEERKRISRELHDDIGQILTALKIDLVMVEGECSCHDGIHSKMRDMQKLLSEGVQSVHSLCRRLRPGALDDLSLPDALEGLIEDWTQRNSEVKCTFDADVDDDALSDDIRTTVFRFVQEALTNASRYAKASLIDIHLVADGHELNFYFSDNGCGMEPGAAEKPTSFGLMGMRERIEVLGGKLHIDSTPGKGTRLEGFIPLAGGGALKKVSNLWNN